MIPTREECIELLKKHNLSDSKIRHSLLVEHVAVSLSKLLIEKGISVNLLIISRAAILHDIGINPITQGKNHAIIGAELCSNENIDLSICNIVRYHIVEALVENNVRTIEEKIVFYADKICKNEIIGIDKRFEPWFKFNNPLTITAKNKVIELEKEIINKLNLTPEELYSLLKLELLKSEVEM